jgi:hypothetical protein
MRERGPVREHMPGHLKNKTRIHCGGFHGVLDHSSPQRSGSALRKGERSERSDTDDSRRFESDSVSLLPPPLCRSAVKSSVPAVAGCRHACGVPAMGSTDTHGMDTYSGGKGVRQRARAGVPCPAAGGVLACPLSLPAEPAGRLGGVGYHPMVQGARAC